MDKAAANTPTRVDDMPCALILDRRIPDYQVVRWLNTIVPGASMMIAFQNFDTCTKIDKTMMESFYAQFGDKYEITPHPLLPPAGPTNSAIFVYEFGRFLRIFPDMGELPYARIPPDCTWHYLSSLRQDIICSVTTMETYGRFTAEAFEEATMSPQRKAFLEMQNCLLTLERNSQQTRERAPAVTIRQVRPRSQSPTLTPGQRDPLDRQKLKRARVLPLSQMAVDDAADWRGTVDTLAAAPGQAGERVDGDRGRHIRKRKQDADSDEDAMKD